MASVKKPAHRLAMPSAPPDTPAAISDSPVPLMTHSLAGPDHAASEG